MAGQIAAAIANADAYEEERRRAEALAEIDQAKTTFFSNVSHEFRTPLTLMLGPLEEVLGQARAATAGGTQPCRGGTPQRLRLLTLGQQPLDFSRIEAGRVQADLRADRLSRFHGRAGLKFPLALRARRAGWWSIARRCPSRVFVDRDMWEKVVLNLLSNAFKFTFEGRSSSRRRRRPTAGQSN